MLIGFFIIFHPPHNPPPDIEAPEKVLDVSISIIPEGNALNLTWTKSSATDLANYKVYRSNTSGFIPGPSNLIASPTLNFYLDSELTDGTIYYYRISAVDEVPNEGPPSDQASGMPVDFIPPSKITGVVITVIPTGSELNITWTKSSATDLANYKVYRSTIPGFTPNGTNLIATPTVNYYLDSGLSTGIPYYYRIVAVDEVPNESPPSDEVSGTPS